MASNDDKRNTFLFRKWKAIHDMLIKDMQKELKESKRLLTTVPFEQRCLLEGCVSFTERLIQEKEYTARGICRNPTSQQSLDEIGNFFYCQIMGARDNLDRAESENKKLKRELVVIKVLPKVTHLDQQSISIILAYCFQ